MAETVAFSRPAALLPVGTHYCPGCSHGVIHRLIAELLDELGLARKMVGIAPVGCSVLAYNYFATDFQEASHGRAPAVATGVKRARPDLFVLAYQGDGDLASIGAAEILHCANRGEKVSVVFVNNATYGMTGGQMAPTTLPGQETTTSPEGRDVEQSGYPVRMAELLATLRTPAFIARAAAHTPRHAIQAKTLLRQAFRCQMEGRCFSLVEILAICPTNWGLPPDEAGRWLERQMLPYYPLGVFKVPEGPDRAPRPLVAAPAAGWEGPR
jgi:2-oxoglutarate/2-oxoacid ferredoxin oxidoreductase subunit beta